MPTIIYVLKCQDDDKFFVGSSNRKLKNPLKYFSDHNQDLSYLEDHPMNELVSTSTVDSLDDVDKEVVRLMTMYGALNVRGGSYTSLNKEMIDVLSNMPCFLKKRCVMCASTNHKSNECTIYNSDDDSDYVPLEHDSDLYDSENDSDCCTDNDL